MAACVLLVLAGIAAAARWGGLEVEPPWRAAGPQEAPSPGVVARRYLWYVAVAVGAGLGAGVLVAGAGGRLAMRLLAATSGDAAQGQITEAEEVVGEITAGGTIGFVVFTALFFGVGTGALYLLVRRWLPRGRLGGLAYGALLLVVAATRVEPLRRDNLDFDIVGPGWVSVVVFGALVVAHGMAVAALAGRYARSLPLLARRPRSVAPYAPLLPMVLMAPVIVPVAVVGALYVLVSRARPSVAGPPSDRVTIAGRVVLVLVGLVGLPGFVSAAADIVARGP
jgi:hypothetical protein